MEKYYHVIVKNNLNMDELEKIQKETGAANRFRSVLVFDNTSLKDVEQRLAAQKLEYDMLISNEAKPWDAVSKLGTKEKKMIADSLTKPKEWYRYRSSAFTIDLWDIAYKQLIAHGIEPTDDRMLQIIKEKLPHVSEIANKIHTQITKKVVGWINDYEKEQENCMEVDKDEY